MLSKPYSLVNLSLVALAPLALAAIGCDGDAENKTPVANAGTDQQVAANTEVKLDGSKSSDPDGDTITYQWTLGTAPSGNTAALVNPTAQKPTFKPTLDGTYEMSLVVKDGTVSSQPDLVVITVGNAVKPLANAGADQNGTVGTAVTLNGSQSSDPQGRTLTFAWSLTTKPAGSNAALQNATAASSTFTPDVAGTYTAQLLVKAGTVNSDPDTVTITVAAAAAAAN